jgi:hypothetical protein
MLRPRRYRTGLKKIEHVIQTTLDRSPGFSRIGLAWQDAAAPQASHRLEED